MKNMKKTQIAILFTVFLGLLALISTQDLGQVYCGRRLAIKLAILCKNGLTKRSESNLGAAFVDSSLPWITAHHARSMGRGKRQVASECCEKPCTLNELLSYCRE